MYLSDIEKSSEITAVSSVSGGSISNAYFARNVFTDDRGGAGDWPQIAPLLRGLSGTSMIRPMSVVAATLFTGALLGAAAGGVAQFVGFSSLVTVLGVLVGFVIGSFIGLGRSYYALRRKLEASIDLLLSSAESLKFIQEPSTPINVAQTIRGLVRFYVAILTQPRRMIDLMRFRMSKLDSLRPSFTPIFCTTDLATGSHFYISNRFVGGASPAAGDRLSSQAMNLVGAAPDLATATAVSASAAFPLVFQPAVIRAVDCGLPVRAGVVPELLRLADGGLFDNFGVSFIDAWLSQELPRAVDGDLGPPPTHVIAVDSGQPSYDGSKRLGLIRAFKRSMDVVHQANSIARRREMALLFGTDAVEGALVGIGDDPYEIARRCENPVRREMVETYLNSLAATSPSFNQSWWASLAQERSPSVPTNLKALEVETLTSLVLHGYIATMARTTVGFGWAPPESPLDIETVRKLAEPLKLSMSESIDLGLRYFNHLQETGRLRSDA